MKTRISKKFLTLLLALCMVVTLIPITAFANNQPPAEGNSYEIVLDNVAEGGTLSADLGSVQYAVESDTSSEVRPVNLNDDYDGEANGVTLTVGNTGGDNPKVKYTYTVKDTTKQLFLYVTPAEGKKATIYEDNQGTMTPIGSVSPSDSPNFLVRNVEPNVRYRVEFTDAAGNPGGENPPAQTAPTAKFVVRYANGATGDVFYKIGNAENWTKANLTEVTEGFGQKRFEASILEALSKDSVVHFKAVPGNDFGIEANQGVCVQAGPNRAMIENGLTEIVSENGISYTLANNVDYSFEFSFDRAGGPAPGGDQKGTDPAPDDEAAKVQFYDSFGNCVSYEQFTANLPGTIVQYDHSEIGATEFGAEAVNNDAKLYWYTDQSDPEPGNWTETYYFSKGDAAGIEISGSSNLDYEVNGTKGSFRGGIFYETGLVQSGHTLKIYPQDDGVRNITWSDDAEVEDQRVENGKVVIEKAVIGDENALITDAPYSQSGNKGYIGIKGGATVTVKLIPDYGYQVGTLELNGRKLTPQDEEATYTFTMPDTNLHLRAIFEESSDEINAAAKGVTGGSIAGGGKVINSGNLRLSVVDSNMTDAQKAEMQSSAAAKGTDILSYLEVDLEKFVSKGDSGQEWIEDLEELSEKIKITLNVGKDLDANKTYVVVREHEGVYEQIPATYDKDAGTLTFESDKFSDYALATVSEDTPAKGTDNPKTGDSGNMMIWLTLLLASCSGVIGSVVYSKKKRTIR